MSYFLVGQREKVIASSFFPPLFHYIIIRLHTYVYVPFVALVTEQKSEQKLNAFKIIDLTQHSVCAQVNDKNTNVARAIGDISIEFLLRTCGLFELNHPSTLSAFFLLYKPFREWFAFKTKLKTTDWFLFALLRQHRDNRDRFEFNEMKTSNHMRKR